MPQKKTKVTPRRTRKLGETRNFKEAWKVYSSALDKFGAVSEIYADALEELTINHRIAIDKYNSTQLRKIKEYSEISNAQSSDHMAISEKARWLKEKYTEMIEDSTTQGEQRSINTIMYNELAQVFRDHVATIRYYTDRVRHLGKL
jgi:hypothetical protein